MEMQQYGAHWRGHVPWRTIEAIQARHSVSYSNTSRATALPNLASDLAVVPSAQPLIKASGLLHSAELQVPGTEGDGVGFALVLGVEACQEF